MSSSFLDGMYYPTADLLFKYSGLNSASISSTTSRVGPGSINIPGNVSSVGRLDYSPPTDLAGVTLGLRFKNVSVLGYNDVIYLKGSEVTLHFGTNYSMTVTYPGGSFVTDPAIWDANTWTYLELQYIKHDSNASVTLRINDSVIDSVTGISLNTDTTKIEFTMDAGSNRTGWYFQDFYLFDGLGSKNNDFVGDSRIDIQRPDAPGTYTDFTPSAGANWQNVDEYACDLDTTYNASSVIGDKDSYNLSDISLTGGEIYAVQQQSIVRKDDASIRYGKQLLISGTTEDLGDERQFSDDFVGYQRTFDVDPDTGITWTESGVNALESGLEITA